MPAALDKLSDEDLILLRTRLRSEMSKRGITDSVGGIGEELAIEYFKKTSGLPKLTAASRGTKNVDANSNRGERYSIKTVCSGSKTGTVYSDGGDHEKQLFEHMLIVKLTSDWVLESIHQLSWPEFVAARSWDKRMNAWYVAFNERALSHGKKIFSSADA